MNLIKKLTLLFLFTITFSTVFGAVNPPDTTTKFIDKTASVYFLEEGKVLYVWLDAPIGYITNTKVWA